MDNTEVAYQRKNHILSESSRRLKNLVNTDHDDSAQELKPKPSEDKVKPTSTTTQGEKKEETEKVKEGDPSTVRFLGYLQLHLYLLAFVVGSFLCYHRHHQETPEFYPRALMNVFKLLKKKNTHVLAERGFKMWDSLPMEHKKKYVKYLSYGTIFLNLYPVLSAPMKPKKTEQEETRVEPLRDTESKFNEAVVKYGASLFRTLSATLLCGLLGYDLSYNLDFLTSLVRRLLKK